MTLEIRFIIERFYSQCGVMVAAIVSKTIGEIRGGSSPLTDTNF